MNQYPTELICPFRDIAKNLIELQLRVEILRALLQQIHKGNVHRHGIYREYPVDIY